MQVGFLSSPPPQNLMPRQTEYPAGQGMENSAIFGVTKKKRGRLLRCHKMLPHRKTWRPQKEAAKISLLLLRFNDHAIKMEQLPPCQYQRFSDPLRPKNAFIPPSQIVVGLFCILEKNERKEKNDPVDIFSIENKDLETIFGK